MEWKLEKNNLDFGKKGQRGRVKVQGHRSSKYDIISADFLPRDAL